MLLWLLPRTLEATVSFLSYYTNSLGSTGFTLGLLLTP